MRGLGCLICFLSLIVVSAALTAQDVEGQVRDRIGRGYPSTGGSSLAVPKSSAQEERESLPPGLVGVRFADGSSMKLALKQETYDLLTPYGKLTIPQSEIRLVELAPRVSDEIAAQIEEAAANLGSPQFEIREKAVADLITLGPKGYPALLRAARGIKDLEVSARMEEVLDTVRTKLPEEQAEPREWDIIHTSNSRIAGRLELKSMQADSAQFGAVELKLADVRDLHFPGSVEEVDISKLEPAPPNLYDKASQIGKTFAFRVTGSVQGGSVYGTDTYTLDSNLSMAAVHAGVVKNGQTGVLRVKIVESPASFASSTRNGITSSAWGPYPAAYKIIKGR